MPYSAAPENGLFAIEEGMMRIVNGPVVRRFGGGRAATHPSFQSTVQISLELTLATHIR